MKYTGQKPICFSFHNLTRYHAFPISYFWVELDRLEICSSHYTMINGFSKERLYRKLGHSEHWSGCQDANIFVIGSDVTDDKFGMKAVVAFRWEPGMLLAFSNSYLNDM